MNITNLQKVIDILNNTDPKQFDMKNIIDVEKGTKCVIGIATNHPDLKIFCPHEFYGFIDVNPYDAQQTNVWTYMFHSTWGNHSSTNTIEHACFRIDRVMKGYKPKHIEIEVPNHIHS
jgi:hypothetical protein